MLSHSLVYRAVMVLLADTILARLDLGRILQVLYDLLYGRLAGQSLQY